MHCEADLPPAGFGEEAGASSVADTATTVDDAPMDEADPGMPTVDDDGSGPGTGGDSLDGAGAAILDGVVDAVRDDAGDAVHEDAGDAVDGDTGDAIHGDADAAGGGDDGTASPRTRAEEHAGAWIDPDSLLDNVSTVAVGVGAGLVTLVLAALVTFWLLPQGFGGAALWVGLAAGAGGGLWMARSRTVFDAARKAGYAVGGLLALVPVAVSVALSWQNPADAIGGIVVFGLFLWPVALVVVGLGWLLGRGGVDDGR